MVISTGASNIEEIKEAVKIIKKYNKKITILHCTLSYPTKDNDANIGAISDLKHNFPKIILDILIILKLLKILMF